MSSIDHDSVRLTRLARTLGEDTVECPHAASADEAVVEGLVPAGHNPWVHRATSTRA